jgi:hypothetical protein
MARIAFVDLWRPSGSVDRKSYVLVGALAFLLKNNLDRFVAAYFFHRYWGFLNYWIPVAGVRRITSLHGREAVFLETMVAIALPFVWLGVVMTLKRLRSAALPIPLVILFFFPFVNLLFFLALGLWPEQTHETPDHTPRRTPSETWLARVVPHTALGSAAISLLLTVPAGVLLAVLGSRLLVTYGWGLFIALPFAMGFCAAVVYGVQRPRSLRGCVGVACLSVAVLGASLLAFAIEGLICLIMAMPIAVPVAAFGGACGYVMQRRHWSQTGVPAFLSLFLLVTPSVQWTEHSLPRSNATFVARSAVEIEAPPEEVWKQVIAFSEIPPPEEWLFRAGIAYPIRAEITGRGVGAERHCVFSTGAFVEPIEVWEEPHRLKFSVTANPPPMQEWSPYARLDTPHLHRFLVSSGGQFLLTPLPNGRTRLEGTTWYRHGLGPASYWRLWSDLIIHKIHLRVLNHIKGEAERSQSPELP